MPAVEQMPPSQLWSSIKEQAELLFAVGSYRRMARTKWMGLPVKDRRSHPRRLPTIGESPDQQGIEEKHRQTATNQNPAHLQKYVDEQGDNKMRAG
jgi:hypothetical protein